MFSYMSWGGLLAAVLVGALLIGAFLIAYDPDYDPFDMYRPDPAQLCAQNPTWTPAECALLARGVLWIGMTDDQALASQGRPQRVNRTVSAHGIREQWVYEYRDKYLYIENGVLTSWQD